MKNVDLSQYKNYFEEYTELRVQENRNTSITLVNGDVMSNSVGVESGVSARVFKNGNWGFASNPNIEDSAIIETIKKATENGKFLGSKIDKGSKELQSRTESSTNLFFTEKSRVTQADKINYLRGLDSYISEKYPNLTSRTLIISNLDMEKQLLTSDGSESYSMIPRSFIYSIMNITIDGENYEMFEIMGGDGEFEENFTDPKILYPNLDKQYQRLMDKSEGVDPVAGLKDVILDADLAGILAHEAIGHTTEADLVLGGSVAGDFLGKEVAAPLITLTDFANEAYGKRCPVPVYIDDEGVKAEDTTIIEDGILKGFMHNKETANHFNTHLTGNARAFKFSDEPLIRMRNTAIKPGKDKLEDMIKSIKDGYYLVRPGNGQADSTAEFMFAVTLGYEIKDGKLGKAIKDTTISGMAFDVLKSVTMVSDDFKWDSSGMCGKKQPIPVGMGGPAIKCKVNIGGK